MNTLIRSAFICASVFVLCIKPVARADELTVNDPAPPLAVSSWLKGDPIEGFEEGGVYVVEFWATWCGPCIAGMPHLSELQRRYGDQVTIIGVNIAEREPEAVPAWMEQRGDALMGYTVAMDEGTTMAQSWMDAAGERGIPASFIVARDGRIAWIGHPEELDTPLERVVAGTWDMESARERREAERAEERERLAIRRQFEERASDALAAFRNARSAEDAVSAAERLLASDPPPDVAMDYFDQAFFRSSFELQDAGRALALVRTHKNLLMTGSVGSLKRYASVMLNAEVFGSTRDGDLVVELTERAHELDSEDIEIAALCARAHMERAIELQRRAVENAEDPDRDAHRKTLARYKRLLRGDE